MKASFFRQMCKPHTCKMGPMLPKIKPFGMFTISFPYKCEYKYDVPKGSFGRGDLSDLYKSVINDHIIA